MIVLSTSKEALACGSGTISGWLTSAAAAAACPATVAVLTPGDDPPDPPAVLTPADDPPELPGGLLIRRDESPDTPAVSWRLGSAVTVTEPSGYSWETERTSPGRSTTQLVSGLASGSGRPRRRQG